MLVHMQMLNFRSEKYKLLHICSHFVSHLTRKSYQHLWPNERNSERAKLKARLPEDVSSGCATG